jgi:Domain of unknown function (DUF4307)
MAQGTVPVALADRYGTRRRAGRPRAGLIAVVVLLASAGIAWAAWVAFASSQAAVQWQDGSFRSIDDGHARFMFHVTTTPGRAVVCTVRLFNDGLTEVGRMDVPAGPSRDRTFTVTATVPTFETATSGTVRACAVR